MLWQILNCSDEVTVHCKLWSALDSLRNQLASLNIFFQHKNEAFDYLNMSVFAGQYYDNSF